MNRAKILSIQRKEIIYKTTSKKRLTRRLFAVLSLVSIFSFLTLLCNEYLNGSLDKLCYVYSPVNSLYNDTSDVVFTSIGVFEKENLDYIIPIKSGEFSQTLDGVEFLVDNAIMVKSIESGFVESVGCSNNGIKYIRIKHSVNIVSEISGIDISGVVVGQVVKKGEDIATAKLGSKILLRILNDGSPIPNLVVSKSKIICPKSK